MIESKGEFIILYIRFYLLQDFERSRPTSTQNKNFQPLKAWRPNFLQFQPDVGNKEIWITEPTHFCGGRGVTPTSHEIFKDGGSSWSLPLLNSGAAQSADSHRSPSPPSSWDGESAGTECRQPSLCCFRMCRVMGSLLTSDDEFRENMKKRPPISQTYNKNEVFLTTEKLISAESELLTSQHQMWWKVNCTRSFFLSFKLE